MRGNGIYQCSNGRYYGGVDIWQKFESGAWTPCCWDEVTGNEWVETDAGELHLLRPISKSELPDESRIKHVDEGVKVITSQITII